MRGSILGCNLIFVICAGHFVTVVRDHYVSKTFSSIFHEEQLIHEMSGLLLCVFEVLRKF